MLLGQFPCQHLLALCYMASVVGYVVVKNEGGGVAFGFDDAGEVGVLRIEGAMRKKWRAERDPCVSPPLRIQDWEGDDTDGTDSSGDPDVAQASAPVDGGVVDDDEEEEPEGGATFHHHNLVECFARERGELEEALTRRFMMMAPMESVQTYQLYLQTDRFEKALLRELANPEIQAQARVTADIDVPWFVWLVDRKELDVAGMARTERSPMVW